MTRIGHTRLRILGLVLGSERITYRGISATAGLSSKSIHGVHEHLKALRKAGLVTWEHHLHYTLRPTCKWIPAEEL